MPHPTAEQREEPVTEELGQVRAMLGENVAQDVEVPVQERDQAVGSSRSAMGVNPFTSTNSTVTSFVPERVDIPCGP